MPKTKTITLSKSTTSGKKTSIKKAKDSNAAKRFRTAYILFSSEKREEIKVRIFINRFSFFCLRRMKIRDYQEKKL